MIGCGVLLRQGPEMSQYHETLLTHRQAPGIEAIWHSHATEDAPALVLPDGRCDVIWRRGADGETTMMLTGPATRSHMAPAASGTTWTGYRLRPGFGKYLWDHVGGVCQDGHIGGDDLRLALPALARAQSAAQGQMIGAILGARPPVLRAALAMIHDSHGDLTVTALARVCGISTRQLSRLFQEWVGLSPKQYAQTMRFRFALKLMHEPNDGLVDVALRAGYADHAHMTRDFTARLRYSPSTLPPLLAQPLLGD